MKRFIILVTPMTISIPAAYGLARSGSERLLMEQLNYNLLFRWLVGMEIDEEGWNHAVFSKNRKRVLKRAQPYLSDEHFTVDGRLIEAWASHKSFRPK